MNAISLPGSLSVAERGDMSSTDLRAHFDDLLPRFRDGDAKEALATLVESLHQVRLVLSEKEWQEVCSEICQSHELLRLLHEDPHVARAFNKPRGYAGDAVMLDYLYQGPPRDVSPLGLRLLSATKDSSNGQSVRWRLGLLADEVDRVAAEVQGARVLAVACGHLREASLSAAIQAGNISELVAMDQDCASIDVVRRECADLPVTAVHGSVAQIIKGQLDLGEFDLIYAAGLYDYLNDRTAHALSAALLSLLSPDGRLFIGNFTPANDARGFMEAFMDWHLICRTEGDLERLCTSLTGERGESFSDPWQNVAYVRMRSRRADRRNSERTRASATRLPAHATLHDVPVCPRVGNELCSTLSHRWSEQSLQSEGRRQLLSQGAWSAPSGFNQRRLGENAMSRFYAFIGRGMSAQVRRCFRFATRRSRSISRLGLAFVCLLALGCSDSSAPADFDIVGTWVLTALEGANGSYGSEWTFDSDGTYEWTFFSDVLGFDLDGDGSYSLDDDVLSVAGIVANTVISTFSDKRLTLNLSSNSFSFLDEDGDRWTYGRQ